MQYPVVGDAFGAVLRECHEAGEQPGTAFEVVERDDGWLGVGDAVRYFATLSGWSLLERQVFAEITGRVLDIGCGAGRHASVLAEAGR